MANNQCCLGCTNRKVGCHVTCNEYKQFKADIEREKEKHSKEKEDRNIYLQYKKEQRTKIIRRLNNKGAL